MSSADRGSTTPDRPHGRTGQASGSGKTGLPVPTATVVLRPLGSPLPIGFLGLAGGTFVLAGLQLGWVAPLQGHDVALVLLAFVFPVQAVATVFGFLARDSVVATGMGVLSGTWLALGAVTASNPPGYTSNAVGLLLMVVGLALLVPVAASGSNKILASTVLATASVRFFLTGAYELSGAQAWKHAAGAAGLLLTAFALYAALAFEMEDQKHRTVLPTWRRGAGAEAFDGDPADQVEQITKEAGVRQEL
ncbi:GPR1/FUN34/YaaH family transporter [Streptomyces sp. NPDC051322]|uniref:GPR1/FUN34/YaaH family transporter n=1 Tax=Streptomyces sp. NPDC051322 TaxID=3154645 RepID=UPI00344D0F7C